MSLTIYPVTPTFTAEVGDLDLAQPTFFRGTPEQPGVSPRAGGDP